MEQNDSKVVNNNSDDNAGQLLWQKVSHNYLSYLKAMQSKKRFYDWLSEELEKQYSIKKSPANLRTKFSTGQLSASLLLAILSICGADISSSRIQEILEQTQIEEKSPK